MHSNYKIDLHTHSSLSHDGGLTRRQYKRILEKGILDYVAVTDHNETSLAKSLHAEFGDKIIVGEEIKTTEGEIIGLYLNKTIPPGLTALETAHEIHNDGGLVYIPHPFEMIRDSLQEDTLMEIIKHTDIIEVFNGRGALRGQPDKAASISFTQNIAMASSSDAHCFLGVRSAYSLVDNIPTSKTLVELLSTGSLKKKHAPFYSLLCPSVNRIRNMLFLRKQI